MESIKEFAHLPMISSCFYIALTQMARVCSISCSCVRSVTKNRSWEKNTFHSRSKNGIYRRLCIFAYDIVMFLYRLYTNGPGVQYQLFLCRKKIDFILYKRMESIKELHICLWYRHFPTWPWYKWPECVESAVPVSVIYQRIDHKKKNRFHSL